MLRVHGRGDNPRDTLPQEDWAKVLRFVSTIDARRAAQEAKLSTAPKYGTSETGATERGHVVVSLASGYQFALDEGDFAYQTGKTPLEVLT